LLFPNQVRDFPRRRRRGNLRAFANETILRSSFDEITGQRLIQVFAQNLIQVFEQGVRFLVSRVAFSLSVAHNDLSPEGEATFFLAEAR
jgi:hypothetical protein